MEITVIIPVYNRATPVRRTLESVRRQSHRPIRLILVDNNSTDGTLDVLRRFKQEYSTESFTVIVDEESTPGAAAARNKGLQAARTEWVMFFDSDDEMHPDLLRSYADAIARHPEAGLIYTDAIIRYGQELECRRISPAGNIIYKNIFHTYLATQRYIVRRDLLLSAGGWNDRLGGWNDWELSLRLLMSDPVTVKMGTKEPLVYINVHPDSITGNRFSDKPHLWEAALDAAKKDIAASGRSDARLLLRCVKYKQAVLAGDYSREGSPEGARLYRKTLEETRHDKLLNAICRIGYRLVSRGIRGTARIALPLFRITGSTAKTGC